MKSKERKELQERTIEDLGVLLTQAKDELITLYLDKKRGKVKNTSSLLHKRKDLARLYTILQEKQIDQSFGRGETK